jgi:hypothetical protein
MATQGTWGDNVTLQVGFKTYILDVTTRLRPSLEKEKKC